MILPQTYGAALALAILSLLCWGSWASTFKLTGKWRFELYYFDFAFGLLLMSLLLAFTAGNIGFDGFSFVDDILHAGKRQIAYGLAAGIVFNLANMLLMASVSVAGIAVAFPITTGAAMIEGALFGYWVKPSANPVMLFGGCALIAAAIVLDAMAHRGLGILKHEDLARRGMAKSTRRSAPVKGIILALVGGVAMGLYLPLLDRARTPEIGLGPYSACVMLAVGALSSTFVYNLFFMNLPLEGRPLEVFDYLKGTISQHAMGLLGGILWCGGAVAGMAAAAGGTDALTGEPVPGSPAQLPPSVIDAIVPGAAVLALLLGLLVWREFKGADMKVKTLTAVMLVLFVCGAGLITIAPRF